MQRGALAVVLLGLLLAPGYASIANVRLVRRVRRRAVDATPPAAPPPPEQPPLFEMPVPKPWALSTDATTEEEVPGLEPTDGFAINASTPNMEAVAPLLDVMRPAGPVIYSIASFFNASNSHPALPGHTPAANRTSLTVLAPSAQALLGLPAQLDATGVLVEPTRAPMMLPTLPWFKGHTRTHTQEIAHQVTQNMMIPRMVPYQYLTNLTKLKTKLGFPVDVIVSPEGEKYLKSGPYTARIVKPDYGRTMVPAVRLVVDSFLLPLNFTKGD